MTWKSLLAAALLLPPLAYVAGMLSTPDPAPEQRPPLVLPVDAEAVGSPAPTEPRTTVRPRPDDADDADDPDERGDRARRNDTDVDDDDDDDDGVAVIRPAPRDADDDDDDRDDGPDDDD